MKEPTDINKVNAIATGIIGAVTKKIEQIGVVSWQPVVIGSSANINAITSGNNPYKRLMRSTKIESNFIRKK